MEGHDGTRGLGIKHPRKGKAIVGVPGAASKCIQDLVTENLYLARYLSRYSGIEGEVFGRSNFEQKKVCCTRKCTLISRG